MLQELPLDDYIFRVITIEHDFYRYGDIFRKKERELLTQKGYYLLCPNVSDHNCAFEDWWIHPKGFSTEVFNLLQSLKLENKNHQEIIEILRAL